MQLWWDAYEAFLPPEADTEGAFPVIPLPAKRFVVDYDGKPSTLYANTLAPRADGLWDMYQKAWFGGPVVEPWFQDLAVAHAEAHVVYVLDDARWVPPGHVGNVLFDVVQWNDVVRQIRKLPRGAFAGLLGKLGGEVSKPSKPSKPIPTGEVHQTPPEEIALRERQKAVACAWAAFLIQGPKELGAKFQPKWKSWLIDYAKQVRAGGVRPDFEGIEIRPGSTWRAGENKWNADARKAALEGWGPKEFEDALARWAATAK